MRNIWGNCRSYESMGRFIENELAESLVVQAIRIQKDLISFGDQEQTSQFFKLIQVSMKQNKYFYYRLQHIFELANLNLPKKFIDVENLYSSKLKDHIKLFQELYSSQVKEITRLNETVNFLKNKVEFLESVKTIKQKPKILPKSKEQEELERLNKIIDDHKKIMADDKRKIQELSNAIQEWKRQNMILSQLNSELQNRSQRRSFSQKQYDNDIGEKQEQIHKMENDIKKYQQLIKDEMQKVAQFTAERQSWIKKEEQNKNNELARTKHIKQLYDNISSLRNQIQRHKGEKQRLQRQVERIKKSQTESQYEIINMNSQPNLLNSENNQLMLEIENLRRSAIEHQKRMKQLNDTAESAYNRSVEMTFRVTQLYGKEKAKNQQVKRQQQKIASLEKQLQDLETKFKELKESSGQKIIDKNYENKKLKAQIDQKKLQIEQYQMEIIELKNKNKKPN